jgi:1-phosphofructokinase family hexose kinase
MSSVKVLMAGPNLAFDRLVGIDRLRPGEVQRFATARVVPGGKAVNAARAARVIGAAPRVAGFLAGETGKALGALIAGEGLELLSVACRGEQRVATIIRETSGRVTVLNEPGPQLDEEDWGRMETAIADALPGFAALLCSGSLPPGCPTEAYARLVRLARSAGTPVLVDATGALLEEALGEGPDLVLPSLSEAAQTLGSTMGQPVEAGPGDGERALELARELAARGARSAVVTAGAAGAAFAGSSGTGTVAAPRVAAVNPIGAGDALAGAMAVASGEGRPLAEALRWAVAVAAASVERERPGDLDPERARGLAATGASP